MQKLQNKARLSFEMLEQEMKTISDETLTRLKGGDILPADCVYQAISFVTGLSAAEIQNTYAQYVIDSTNTGMNLASANAWVGFKGVEEKDVSWLMDHYGLSSGYSSTGTGSTSSSGDAGIMFLDTNGDGHADHAINLTGNTESSGWYFYDAQSSSGGTVSKTDPMIRWTYGNGG